MTKAQRTDPKTLPELLARLEADLHQVNTELKEMQIMDDDDRGLQQYKYGERYRLEDATYWITKILNTPRPE